MTTSPPRARERWPLRLWLSLTSGLATLALLEIGVRVYVALRPEPSLQDAFDEAATPEPGGKARWLNALRVHSNERIAYALRPDFDGLIPVAGRSMRIATNRHGFRWHDWQAGKAPGTVRIVGLGDSVMFGWGVDVEATYLWRLERTLAERYPDVRHEVISLAVGGYNTVQQVATLKEVGLELRPDVVILNLVGNDAGGIIYTNARPDPWSLARSFAFRWIVRREDPRASQTYAGIECFRSALAELRELGRAHGFHVLVLTYLETPEIVPLFAIAKELGLDTLDLGATTSAHMREMNIEDYLWSVLAIPEDHHPSMRHHELLAADLLEGLEARGIVGPKAR